MRVDLDKLSKRIADYYDGKGGSVGMDLENDIEPMIAELQLLRQISFYHINRKRTVCHGCQTQGTGLTKTFPHTDNCPVKAWEAMR